MPKARRAPGPKGHWLVGHLKEFRRGQLAFYERIARVYGDAASFRLGPFPFIMFSHPDQIEEVLVTHNRKFVKDHAVNFLRPVLGKGLLTNEYEDWLRQRRLIQPAFSRARIEGYGNAMVALCENYLAECEDGQVRDVHADMLRLALAVAGQTLMGVNPTAESSNISECLDLIMQDFNDRMEASIPPPHWFPVPINFRLKKTVRRLDDIVNRIISERRTDTESGDDLLSAMIRARDEEDGTRMTDKQLRDETITLLLAGHETTANALAWTWYLLAQHPQVQARLGNEIDTVLDGRSPSVADVPRLVYTEQIVKESMRLYPPAYIIGREASENCVIGGYEVPKKTTVALCQWVVHRDGRWFGNPNEFNPDRWTPEFSEKLPKYAWFPFGGGPRVCIGNTFAMLEMTLLIASIASRFRFSLVSDDPVEPEPAVTLRPRGGIRLLLEQRRTHLTEGRQVAEHAVWTPPDLARRGAGNGVNRK